MIKNNIKTKNGKDYTRWSVRNILVNPVYCIADKDIYNYYFKQDIEIFSDESNFDGKHGIMAYSKTEQKSNKSTKNCYGKRIIS